jgi:putative transcriptional regulator
MPDVKSVREEQGMTQQQFAQTYRIPLATLKNWEQGRRDPDSTIGAYMQVIAARPAMVQKILSGQ